MTQQKNKAAIRSTIVRFLTAGGLPLGIAVLQEIVKPDRDWPIIATMVAGMDGFGGGVYGCLKAEGAIISALRN